MRRRIYIPCTTDSNRFTWNNVMECNPGSEVKEVVARPSSARSSSIGRQRAGASIHVADSDVQAQLLLDSQVTFCVSVTSSPYG